MKKILKPNYYETFSCIMDKCENHCCKEWRIDFDKRSFKKYEQLGLLKDNDGNKRALRNPQHASMLDYGYAVLDAELVCSFFKDGLCEIHKNYGSECLSITCDTYPRRHNDLDTHLEYSLSISCPEVARKLLTNKQALEFTFYEEENVIRAPMKYKMLSREEYGRDSICYYFWDIRAFSIQIIQDRLFTFNERLLILGYFIKQLGKLNNEDRSKVVDIIDNVEVLMSKPETFKLELKNMSVIKFKPSISFFKNISTEKHTNTMVNKNYLRMISDILTGLQINQEKNDFQSVYVLYEKIFNEIFLPYLEANEYIFENLLVNEIYTRTFPFYDGELDILTSYQNLILVFYMVQFSITGVAAAKGYIDEQLVVEVVHSLFRRMEHSKSLMDIFMMTD